MKANVIQYRQNINSRFMYWFLMWIQCKYKVCWQTPPYFK